MKPTHFIPFLISWSTTSLAATVQLTPRGNTHICRPPIWISREDTSASRGTAHHDCREVARAIREDQPQPDIFTTPGGPGYTFVGHGHWCDFGVRGVEPNAGTLWIGKGDVADAIEDAVDYVFPPWKICEGGACQLHAQGRMECDGGVDGEIGRSNWIDFVIWA